MFKVPVKQFFDLNFYLQQGHVEKIMYVNVKDMPVFVET